MTGKRARPGHDQHRLPPSLLAHLLVGLLPAVLAFTASFVVSPTYESSTRLLVHGRDATFLSSTGEDLAALPGVVDASLSQPLLPTYAGNATGRSVATAVTDEPDPDEQTPPTSPLALVSQALDWVYRCGRAFVTAGFGAPVEPREQAVRDVPEGITAQPVGISAGSSSGQPRSYVPEVVASRNSPAQASAVAEQPVAEGSHRYQRDARTHLRTWRSRRRPRSEQRARDQLRPDAAAGCASCGSRRARSSRTSAGRPATARLAAARHVRLPAAEPAYSSTPLPISAGTRTPGPAGTLMPRHLRLALEPIDA